MSVSEQLLDEVEQLVWALVDEEISDEQLARLERLLLDNPEARKTYVQCMQMHADLQFMFREQRNRPPSGSSRLPAAVVNALPMTAAGLPLPGAQS